MNRELFHFSLLKNIVVMDVGEYISIAVRNSMHLFCIATVERVDIP